VIGILSVEGYGGASENRSETNRSDGSSMSDKRR
jgi:hypothetical protein